MATQKSFADSSSLVWKDRETLSYLENGRSLDIWVDVESGLFNSGRVVDLTLIKFWNSTPSGEPVELTDMEKKDIKEKIIQYYEEFRKKVRFIFKRHNGLLYTKSKIPA